MDLGAVGLDGLVGGSIGCSDGETKHKWYGSGLLKQERSGGGGNRNNNEDDDEYWRSNKVAKSINGERNSSSSLLRSNASLFCEQQQQMLSFSSPKPDTFPYHYLPLSTSNRNTGCYSWGSNSMHGNGNGIGIGMRGAFTPSQWMELEQQALIYKYITANVPVPSHLLIPIKKALHSHFFRPSAVGWAGFHLGFSNSTDPEPGRCRRTDGKKWRCSRDAVVDQKYCERHMNRGRHRSRKPVEGHNGHALSGNNNNNSNNNNSSKVIISNSANVVVPGNTTTPSNTLSFAQHHPKNMHPLASSDSSPPNTISRMFITTNNNEESNGSERIPEAEDALPMLPPTLELKPKENPFIIPKHQIPYQQESSRDEFGLVTSDSLLNPSQKSNTTLTDSRETDSNHSLRHFIDDWPKTQTDRTTLSSWPESERTELSISIPMTTTSNDFMSSTSSPTNDKVTLSPLRLSRELDPIQMGLGVGNNALSDSSNSSRQANWIPITWESSMGGPLGEVLNLSTNNNNGSDNQCGKNNNSSSALNLMSDGWDNTNSPPLGSSPTGVLQKTAFGSLSNSSAGSSPRAENKTQEGSSLCNDLLMPAL